MSFLISAKLSLAGYLALLAGFQLLTPSAQGQGIGQGYTSRDRGFYWYGVGAGIAITVCELERNGDLTKGFARPFIRDARSSDDLRKEPKAVEGLMDASRSNNCKGL